MNQMLVSKPSRTEIEAQHQNLETRLVYTFEKLKLQISDQLEDELTTNLILNMSSLKEKYLASINEEAPTMAVDTKNQVHGKITYSKAEADFLGTGSKGTKVYRGTWDGRLAAIKRLDCEQTDMVTIIHEINTPKKCDAHKNVVRYFGEEHPDDYILLALELCDLTLEKWVERKRSGDIFEIVCMYVFKGGRVTWKSQTSAAHPKQI
ncbi:unnamed protein product [Orchesella dallaii]|uniref:Protein kinase domain-containing protein n=1 Tax=Orchesella dallaii TaxID=48710 RepID=A0ABP1PIB6_9HEXA